MILLSREGLKRSKVTGIVYAILVKKYGYFPKPEKSNLIVKDDHLLKANDIFKHSNVKITFNGQRQLGAVIGSLNYKNAFVNEKVDSMVSYLS